MAQLNTNPLEKYKIFSSSHPIGQMKRILPESYKHSEFFLQSITCFFLPLKKKKKKKLMKVTRGC